MFKALFVFSSDLFVEYSIGRKRFGAIFAMPKFFDSLNIRIASMIYSHALFSLP